MHPEVKAAFEAQQIGAKWYVSVFKGDQRAPAKKPIVTFVDQITTEGVNYGAVESARLMAAAEDMNLWDNPTGSPKYLKKCTGTNCPNWFGATIMRHNNTRTMDDLRAQQAKTFQEVHYDLTGVEVEHMWPEYFPHWGLGQMEHLYNLRDRQGEHGLFLAGGIAHFESIEFILRYNKWLATSVLDKLGALRQQQPVEEEVVV
eukprot:TRINITY_DN84029_c0_g1_i1.p3 TRINITY_DN84029_c0_g1~~TRINITY_DN84029_c0_g1_i1.p3  ORF type:complete len:202 (+),score=44.79 TRINITY_DN84029_c0_g1_i1:1168-1773(+)